MAQAALRTLLLAAIVQLGLGLLRVKRPQLRLIAWTVVLAASLAMPALQWATPLRLSVLPNLPGAASIATADLPRQGPVSEAFVPAAAEDVAAPTTAMPWLEALYFLVGGTLLARLAVGIALSLRLLGRAVPVHPDWAADTFMRISRDVAAPVTVANVILLPLDAVNWPASMRDAVLAHERAHIARWDFAMLLASQINRAVFWFSPLSWWLHRRLAALAELAADDQAMEAMGNRPAYAEVLLEMGRRSGPLRGLAMARPVTLKYRIERILSDRIAVTSVSPSRQMIVVLAAAGLSIMAASSRPISVPPLARVASAEQSQSPSSAAFSPPLLAAAGDDLPEPLAPILPKIVAQPPREPVAPAESTTLAYAPAAREAARPIAHPVTRNTLPRPPSYPAVQRIRTERPDGALRARALVPAGSALRSEDRHGIPNSVVAAQRPVGEPPLLKPTDEPYCTGTYLPRPGGARTDGPVDVVQAKYFQESDGTPWLKLFLGVRTRARLTGFDVERTSIRTTVVTTLPRGANHVTGTTHGTYGSIDFECVQPNARL